MVLTEWEVIGKGAMWWTYWSPPGLQVLLPACFVSLAVLNGFSNFCGSVKALFSIWRPHTEQTTISPLCCLSVYVKAAPRWASSELWHLCWAGRAIKAVSKWHRHSRASPDSLFACVSFYLKYLGEWSFPLIPLKLENNWQVIHFNLKLMIDTVGHR